VQDLSTSRRDFLALSASSLVVPALTPSLAAAGAALGHQDPSTARVTLGLVGMGIRGRAMLRRSFLPNDGFHVAAVCDVDTTRREDAGRTVDEHHGSQGCGQYGDHRELVARDDIDAVVIATPDHWHALQILDAIRAGKDVYCEKPLTLTLREAQLVSSAARSAGTVFQTGSQQRTEFSHRFVTACEYVRNGRIGEVLTVHVGVGDPPRACDLGAEDLEPGLDWDRWLGPAPERPYNSTLSPRGVHGHYPRWRDYREYAGGGLADMGAHHLDIAQWGLGMDSTGPVRVEPPQSQSAKRGAALVYANGARLVHGGPSGATFIGTRGVIHVDRGRLSSTPDSILKEELPEQAERLPRHSSHASDWLESLRTRTQTMCSAETGARSAALCQLLNLAYRHRRELDWNPQAWRFENDPEANTWLDYERRAGFDLAGG